MCTILVSNFYLRLRNLTILCHMSFIAEILPLVLLLNRKSLVKIFLFLYIMLIKDQSTVGSLATKKLFQGTVIKIYFNRAFRVVLFLVWKLLCLSTFLSRRKLYIHRIRWFINPYCTSRNLDWSVKNEYYMWKTFLKITFNEWKLCEENYSYKYVY